MQTLKEMCFFFSGQQKTNSFYAQKGRFYPHLLSPLAVADWISSWLTTVAFSSCLLFLGKAGKGT